MSSCERIGQSPPPAPDTLMPMGAWIRLDMSEISELSGIIGFTYLDKEAGFSAQGSALTENGLDESSRVVVRLPMQGVAWRLLDADEISSLGLESPPSWVAESYGAQPPAGVLWGAWREHPKLKGRFLPDYPDDLQIYVHDGGPRVSSNRAELVWVSVNGMDGEVFQGRVLNQPSNLLSVTGGSEIKFVMAEGAKFPVMVTEKYLLEREAWVILPCDKCGLAELFDAPSDLIRAVFPSLPPDGEVGMFTTFCPLCGGIQGVKLHNASTPGGVVPTSAASSLKRPWWRFW
jgi:hypothetical protein